MLLLWILSLAASFLLPSSGEVGSSFQHCTTFFLHGEAPALKPMNPARICQYYKGRYQFATMYDRDGRIPVFSAYKYQNPDLLEMEGQPEMDWKIEPQLAVPDDHQRISMELERDSDINYRELANSQAVSLDYTEAFPYDKGQLVPASHQRTRDSEAATYTLTNVVPLFQELMDGEWDDFLRHMSQSTKDCHETYVIVGAVPGDESISDGRVNVPSHIWAAVCCLTKKETNRSWGVIAENNQNKVERFSLKELETKLNHNYRKTGINLFNGGCY